MNTLLLSNFFSICDAPRAWGVYFQDSASPQMEALVELHDNIMFYLVIILFGVGWILVSIIRNYVSSRSPISNKYLNHGTLIELIWTITPALILILIAFPSFKLLYLMDEVTDPSLTVFVEGHQWYWSYQYPDFLNEDEEELEFMSQSAGNISGIKIEDEASPVIKEEPRDGSTPPADNWMLDFANQLRYQKSAWAPGPEQANLTIRDLGYTRYSSTPFIYQHWSDGEHRMCKLLHERPHFFHPSTKETKVEGLIASIEREHGV